MNQFQKLTLLNQNNLKVQEEKREWKLLYPSTCYPQYISTP